MKKVKDTDKAICIVDIDNTLKCVDNGKTCWNYGLGRELKENSDKEHILLWSSCTDETMKEAIAFLKSQFDLEVSYDNETKPKNISRIIDDKCKCYTFDYRDWNDNVVFIPVEKEEESETGTETTTIKKDETITGGNNNGESL